MPGVSTSNSPSESQGALVTNVDGGVSVAGQQVTISGDVVGRDKITTIGYTVEQVSSLLTQISGAFQPKPFDGRCPYLGLDAFSEDDADRFFGRETLVRELVTRVKESRFVVIAGPSGSGKSSLVRAGLIHALKQGALPTSDRWLYATLTPGRDPIESLALAMSRMAKSPGAGKYVRECYAERNALHELSESQLSERPDQRAVIFVDQFEEVFTQVSKEDDRVAFLNLLTHVATIDQGRVMVLFALRSDFVSNCALYPELNALLNQQFMQVGAMQPDELVSAIARPALQVGLRIDPDLVAHIVNDMQDEPGALPLMQFALRDLFDARSAQGGVLALTLSDYLARGGLHKALERHADAAFAKLNEPEQHLARTIFGGLIEIGRGVQDTRRTAAVDELVPVNVAVTQVEAVIQKLADARLITTNEQGDKDTVTISHERLINAWPWLQRLVNENREVIALQNQIVEDAQEWADNRRDASYLYRGARLATAREQLNTQKIVLSGQAHAFVTASGAADEAERQREEDRRQKELADARRLAESEKQRAEEQTQSAAKLRRRAVYLIGALGVAVGLGLLAGLFGVQSSQNADAANRNAATAEAASKLAVANASTAQAASFKAVMEANTRATAESNANQQRDEAQRQDAIASSRRLAALALNKIVMEGTEPDYPVRTLALQMARAALERAYTDEAERALREALRLSLPEFTLGENGPGPLGALEFSPNSQQVAVVLADRARYAWVFEIESGKLLSSLTISDEITSLSFSPDGQNLAILGGDGVVQVWEVSASEARERIQLAGNPGAVSMAYTPDGQRLLIVGKDAVARIVDANDGHSVAVGPRLNGNISQALFSSDGQRIVTLTDQGKVRLWDAMTGATLAEIAGTASIETIMAVYLSPDGERVLFVTQQGLLQQWLISTQQLTTLRDFGFTPIAAAFSPDGSRLGLLRDGLTLYAIDTGELLAVPALDDSAVHLAFSSDNQRLITFDFNVRLWDARTGQRLAEIDPGRALSGGSAAMVNATFSPDGQTIGLYGEGYTDPMMRFEPVYLAGLLEWSRQLAPSELTCKQRVQYLLSNEVCPTPTTEPTRVNGVTPTP